MCRFFANQHPDSYAFETRSIRLNGQSTSIRLEKIFWRILEQIARQQEMSVPRFISTLHDEILGLWGEVANFASHLRCICIVALENGPAAASLDGRRVA
ncbi:ribbon-helix-helix domain-containing protein [Rhodoblastus sp.]|uniref:ribbon-helix-helix domain-containing protein n=1 Tax=Rhodoblastus sp. TaxID=1962975 RepID=UPI0035B42DA1